MFHSFLASVGFSNSNPFWPLLSCWLLCPSQPPTLFLFSHPFLASSFILTSYPFLVLPPYISLHLFLAFNFLSASEPFFCLPPLFSLPPFCSFFFLVILLLRFGSCLSGSLKIPAWAIRNRSAGSWHTAARRNSAPCRELSKAAACHLCYICQSLILKWCSPPQLFKELWTNPSPNKFWGTCFFGHCTQTIPLSWSQHQWMAMETFVLLLSVVSRIVFIP